MFWCQPKRTNANFKQQKHFHPTSTIAHGIRSGSELATRRGQQVMRSNTKLHPTSFGDHGGESEDVLPFDLNCIEPENQEHMQTC
jgi:hypothetical protein